MEHKNISKPDTPSLDVKNINDPEVASVLKQIKPDVVVVSGTGIIRESILSLADTFINIHVGITPKYRGVHGGFWASYNRDTQNIGVSIHLIDPGVDTGRILYQGEVRLDPLFDTFRTIPVKQYLVGVDLMIQAVKDALAGMLAPFMRSDMDSKQWYHPTILEYWRWNKIFRNRKR